MENVVVLRVHRRKRSRNSTVNWVRQCTRIKVETRRNSSSWRKLIKHLRMRRREEIGKSTAILMDLVVMIEWHVTLTLCLCLFNAVFYLSYSIRYRFAQMDRRRKELIFGPRSLCSYFHGSVTNFRCMYLNFSYYKIT